MSELASAAGQSGLVFDIQRFSLHDGPGIRTTVFLKGCPLRCLWCHNPESIGPRPEVVVRADRCLSCGACVEACPLPEGPLPAGAQVGEAGCLACGRCVDACPGAAREIVGRERAVDDVVVAALRDRIFYDDSGGGVTFSGGEPLAQPEFLVACLDRLRSEDVHLALDTCGLAPRQVLLDAAARVDLVLYDVKTMDPEEHRRLTGAPLEPILDNLRALAASHPAIWLRVPVVPDVTDEPRSLEAVARLASELSAVERVSLLPYHRLGTAKLERLGGRPGGLDVRTPDPARLEAAERTFRDAGVTVTIGG